MITDNATALLEQALAAWRDTGELPEPPNPRVVVGAVAVDTCCDGFLVLSLEQFVWWNPFPFEALMRGGAGVVIPFGSTMPCTGTYGAVGTLWCGACIPVLDEGGRAPAAGEEQAAMIRVADLTQAIATALVCDDDERWVVGGSTFYGTEGGCLLGQIAVRLDG